LKVIHFSELIKLFKEKGGRMTNKPIDEKDEKELKKHDEKVEERDVLSTVVWAAILIWAGVVFLAVNQGWLDRLNLPESIMSHILPNGLRMFEVSSWSLIALGAGVILLMELVVRLTVPAFHRHIGSTLIVAAVFVGLGLGNWFGWDIVWPIILIAVGILVLVGGLTRRH
jgi:hypothetical protein